QNGEYDANGHSPWYGYGKVNAEKAVKRAQALGIITLENVRMLSALIDVDGLDSGNETITLRNLTEAEMNLQGWYLEIRGKKIPLSDVLLGNETKTIRMVHSKRCFPNTGATIHLCNASGTILHTVRYTKKQVKKGHSIDFSN
ncbi:MAG TPA: hypothetical protein VEB42_07875, partial [Chitinophagaceae bacterium]|nr:hypothetical protein [Chitinophagaceae bacterium]